MTKVKSDTAHEVPFTQFLRPHGRSKPVVIERPKRIAEKADRVRLAGLSFEVEELLTGEVSLTVADRSEGVDLFIEVVPNGPEVPEAVDRLVNDAYDSLERSGTNEEADDESG